MNFIIRYKHDGGLTLWLFFFISEANCVSSRTTTFEYDCYDDCLTAIELFLATHTYTNDTHTHLNMNLHFARLTWKPHQNTTSKILVTKCYRQKTQNYFQKYTKET